MVTIPEVRQKISDALLDGELTTEERTDISKDLAAVTGPADKGEKAKLEKLIARLNNVASSADAPTPEKVTDQSLAELQSKAKDAENALKKITDEIKLLEAEFANKTTKVERKKEITKKLAQLKTRALATEFIMKSHLKKAAKSALASGKLDKLDTRMFDKHNVHYSKESASKSNFKMNSGKAMSTGANQAQQNAQQSGAAKAQGASFPTMKASVGGASFNTNAYMHSLGMDNAILQSYDSVLENQKRGRELVTLFAYFANRAASGDMGMMYQFMKFLTYIVTKDKAKQQIDMGKKLIALQDESRRATNKLLNAKSDPNDPNASFEQSKLLTEVKSETDAIATSQKLIAQMMEEFTVISETLTSSTKVTLDSHRRIQQTVSRA